MKDPEKSFDFQLNIGFVVFAIIFIYLTITVIASFMKETISVCRVEEGQIVNSASFTGVCVRDEEVVTSTGNGYINFYVGEGEKVANAGNIYLLSSEAPESSSENLQDTAGTSTGNYSEIRDQISVFSKTIQTVSFHKFIRCAITFRAFPQRC